MAAVYKIIKNTRTRTLTRARPYKHTSYLWGFCSSPVIFMELLPKLVKGTQAVTAQGRLYAYLQTATAQYRVSEEIARIKSFLVSQQSRFLGHFGCSCWSLEGADLHFFSFILFLFYLMRSLSAVTAFFGGVTHTRSGSHSSWESSSGVNIILHHCSQICHTALSTFMSGLVMGSSDVGERRRDGVTESYPHNPWEALHAVSKRAFKFWCSGKPYGSK